jgi:transcriptional regulator with XRE-family HTH domain
VFKVDHLPEGTQLRLARIAAGLTLFEVGRLADVSPPRLSEFERGRPSLPPDSIARVQTILARQLRQMATGDFGVT